MKFNFLTGLFLLTSATVAHADRFDCPEVAGVATLREIGDDKWKTVPDSQIQTVRTQPVSFGGVYQSGVVKLECSTVVYDAQGSFLSIAGLITREIQGYDVYSCRIVNHLQLDSHFDCTKNPDSEEQIIEVSPKTQIGRHVEL